MKEKTIVILILMFFCSCDSKHSVKDNIGKYRLKDTLTSKIEVSKANDNYATTDSLANLRIDGVRRLSYKFNVDKSGYLLKTIIVYSDNIPIQIIEANKEIDQKDFQLIDWNFDGYKDITVRHSCGTGGCSYWIWNYSVENQKYYFNKELSDMLGLEIDSISKYIIFHYRAGWSEEYWDSLQYKNNKLSFVKGLYLQRWTDAVGNTWVKNTRSKMINNKLITKIDSSIVK